MGESTRIKIQAEHLDIECTNSKCTYCISWKCGHADVIDGKFSCNWRTTKKPKKYFCRGCSKYTLDEPFGKCECGYIDEE